MPLKSVVVFFKILNLQYAQMKVALRNSNVEGAFRAIECRLAQMNVFSRYCLTFSANDCVFSLNEQQKVQLLACLFQQLLSPKVWHRIGC